MGTGTVVCGREITRQLTPGQSRHGKIDGWYQPFTYSPEYVLYANGNPLGEVYPLADERWMSRLYPHNGKEYDTQDEAMLFLEAVRALGV